MKMGLFLALTALVASTANADMFPKHVPGNSGEVMEKTGKTGENVVYYGGPVISHAQIYVILWGNNVSPTTKAAMPDFYASMVNSTYMDFLKVYNTTHVTVQDSTHAPSNQTVGRGTFLQTIQIAPAKLTGTLDDTEIQAELEKQMIAGKIPAATADTLYMIHFPKGLTITTKDGSTVMTSCQQFCAFHNGFQPKKGLPVFYGVMPDLDSISCSMGCGMGASALTRITISASHEMIEAITDPFPTPGTHPTFPQAWNTTGGEEVGDLCQSNKGTLTGISATYTVQQEWDNSLKGCTTGSYRH